MSLTWSNSAWQEERNLSDNDDDDDDNVDDDDDEEKDVSLVLYIDISLRYWNVDGPWGAKTSSTLLFCSTYSGSVKVASS